MLAAPSAAADIRALFGKLPKQIMNGVQVIDCNGSNVRSQRAYQEISSDSLTWLSNVSGERKPEKN